MKKIGCQTVITDDAGNEILKDKKKFTSYKDADNAAKLQMASENINQILVAYKCKMCSNFHIGRNGKIMDNLDKRKSIRDAEIIRKEKELKKLKNFKPKIVGFIDLSLIDNKPIPK